ncbi:Beta-barrel assembly machine subunit BamD [Azotobacter beijerinckii]|uniref:Beta-barrel assembly machine subunit BamD n=2 Tax=Azotobacter beijerinckii TaxID=170623 RepID=A0A1H9P981_9GAMM|nr:Beta-barrel assembly machine subunit BamD [Azotobacter beijerinckii]
MITCRSASRFVSVALLALLAAGCTPVGKNLRSALSEGASRERALYDESMELIQSRQHEAAANRLVELLRTDPQGELRIEATLALAYSQLQLDRPKEAAQIAAQVIEENAETERMDYALYLHANALLALSPAPSAAQVRQAAEDLERLRQRYPDSQYAERAKETLAKVEERLADNELQAARLQWQRNQPVAALNRCRYIIERYPDSAAVSGALELMISAYRQLGLNELADSTRAIRKGSVPP